MVYSSRHLQEQIKTQEALRTAKRLLVLCPNKTVKYKIVSPPKAGKQSSYLACLKSAIKLVNHVFNGVNLSVLNLKGYGKSFKQVAIAFCLMVILVGTMFLPVLTQPALAQSGATASARNASIEKLQVLSDRFDRLEKFVYQRNWNDVITYIHGPFGEIRREIRAIVGQLDKTQKSKATDLANDLFKNFIKIDNAAKDRDGTAIDAAFKDALQSFEAIIDLVI